MFEITVIKSLNEPSGYMAAVDATITKNVNTDIQEDRFDAIDAIDAFESFFNSGGWDKYK
jgi:hypothetical protein